MSAEELLHEAELDPTDGELYEVGNDEIDVINDDGGQPSWSSLTVAALKTALTERGLQTTGRKADLVARLEASQSGRLPLLSLLDTDWGHTKRCRDDGTVSMGRPAAVICPVIVLHRRLASLIAETSLHSFIHSFICS